MTALDFAARGLASQALAQMRLGTFATLASASIAEGIDRIGTTGHAENGKGAATYISDTLCDAALLAAHPACVAQTANGRIFRLLPEAGAITVEQCGAVGDQGEANAANDQPAIQAALDYAAATGIGEVRFCQRHYSVWATQRTSPVDQLYARDGHPLTVTATVALRSACGDSHLNFRGRDGSSMEDDWYLVKGTAGAANPDQVWRGGGLFVLGDHGTIPSPLAIEKLTIDHVHLIGGRSRTGNHGWPADTGTGDGWDTTDKGLWLQDSVIGRIELNGVEISGFKGELYYIGGADVVTHHALTDCHFHTTNADALNAGTSGATLTARGCRFGDAYQSAEVLGGAGQTYAQCEFYDSTSLSIWGGPTPTFASGQPYYYATRDPALPVPFIHFDDCRFERTGNAYLGCWTRGNLTTIDTQVAIGAYGQQKTTDIDLSITAWCDQVSGLSVIGFQGPSDLVTQVPGMTAGTYFEKPARVRIHVASAKRTQAARDADIHWGAVFYLGGLFDKDTVLLSAGECEAKFHVQPYGSFAELPFVVLPSRFLPTNWGQPGGGEYSYPAPASTVTLTPKGVAHAFYPSGAGVVEVEFGATYDYADGQRFQIVHGGGGSGDRIIRLSPGSAGLELSCAIELKNSGDRVELVYSAASAKWRLADAAYTESGTLDPARIPDLDAAKVVSGTLDPARIPAPDWSAITGKPIFAPVATSGAYADLSGAPALGLLAEAPLADPNADRIPFWDDSAGAVSWLEMGSGLAIAGSVLSASGGGGGGTAQWTQIASTSPSAVASVDFAAIAQTYSDLLIEFAGLSHDNAASAGVNIAFSNDGITFSNGLYIAQPGSSSVTWRGAVLLPNYTADNGTAINRISDMPSASPAAVYATSSLLNWFCTGGIGALRFSLTAGQFDAGTLTLYGR